MRFYRFILTAALALLTSGCMAAATGIANAPVAFSDITIKRDIAYAPGEAGRLDIYLPPAATAKPWPVIVFFYGGKWTTGKKEYYAFVGHALATRGYMVVIPDYRQYPDVRFPAFIEDTAAATAWTVKNITAYGGDSGRVYLSGHSSGAHMAALVAADPRYLAAYDLQRTAIRAFAGLAGPYDFVPEEPDLKDMFGPPERYPQMQVTTFIDGGQPPMLLQHGADDDTVWQLNLEKLKSGIDRAGGVVETRIYPDMGHAGIVANLSWVSRKQVVADDMIAFFERQR